MAHRATWQDLLANAFAKSGSHGQPGESLESHTREVLHRLSQLAIRHAELPHLVNEPRLWHRAFWACWLHDLGKLTSGFQDSLKGTSWGGQRHEVFSLLFLPWVADPAGPDFPWIAAGIASHHRDAEAIVAGRYNPAFPLEDWDIERWITSIPDDWIVGIAQWLAEASQRWIMDFGFAEYVEAPWQVPAPPDPERLRQEGSTTVRRGLRVYERLWRRLATEPADSAANRAAIALRGLVLLSDHLGSAHASPLAPLALPNAEQVLNLLNLESLRPHQQDAATRSGSIMFIAPTGSGKTEAAMLWAHKQTETRLHASLIYVLPYQASINAMHTRLQKLTANAPVALMHGRSAQVLYRELMEDKSYDAPGADKAARRMENLTRLHQPAISVTTPYQLLRAAYRVKGYEALWTAMSGGILILDEIHAYEAERLGLLLSLAAELQRAWGGVVCSISATTPSWLAGLLNKHLHLEQLTVAPALFAKFRRHRINLMEGALLAPAVLDHIAERCREGSSMLVAANTVQTAQMTWRELQDRLVPENVLLLHSRFTVGDRLAKEEAVRSRLDRHEPITVVATQVIEVSLDLDFDGIVTEPAPLEALAQRFGRVNRRGSKGIVPVTVLTEPRSGQRIYDDRLVENCLDVLAGHDGEEIDEARLSEWLDKAYAGGLDEEWMLRVEAGLTTFQRGCIETLRAFASDEDLGRQFDKLFDGTEVLPLSLREEYVQRREDSVLHANELLVPIADWQERRFRSRMSWEKDWFLHTIDLPYDPDLGLIG